MRLLFDTQLLLWAAAEPKRLTKDVREVIDNPENEPVFSPANIWEVAAKVGPGRPDFQLDPRMLRRALIDNMVIASCPSPAVMPPPSTTCRLN